MKQFLLFGAFGNVGFELCRTILDKGYPVYHVDVGENPEEQNSREEKMLLIGRNSNFRFYKDMDEAPKGDFIVIVPFFDWEDGEHRPLPLMIKEVEDLLKRFNTSNIKRKMIILKEKYGENKVTDTDSVFKNFQPIFLPDDFMNNRSGMNEKMEQIIFQEMQI